VGLVVCLKKEERNIGSLNEHNEVNNDSDDNDDLEELVKTNDIDIISRTQKSMK
jgi:hypothetical protein